MIKKHLSVHSQDRDITKYPFANLFEVDLPVDYKNVASMRLNDILIPSKLYVFSKCNQNTRLLFRTLGTTHLIEITEGTYTPAQLALELKGQIKKVIEISSGIPPFNVYYNEISQKFLFVCDAPFDLDFTGSQFDGTNYVNYASWGLGFNLGFNKNYYESVQKNVNFYWNNTIPSTNAYVIESSNTIDITGDSQIYMEVFLFNSMDEILPYTERSNWMHTEKHVKYGGKHNSAFAKIPIMGHTELHRHNFNTNIFWSEPPLERIQKLKFKFRYHDGRLVDFGTTEFSFTIELSLIRSDVPPFAK
jgi:hypothetical protein